MINNLLKPLNICLILIGITFLLLIYYLSLTNSLEGMRLFVDLIGSFTVTFLGVFASMAYSKKIDQEKTTQNSQDYFKNGLILLSSEMNFNVATLNHIVEGIKTMPKIVNQYFTTYGLLIETSKSIKTNAYYSILTTPAIHEIIKNLDLFNSVQLAYNNMELAVNGLSLTQNVFSDYRINHPSQDQLTLMISQSETIINSEQQAISSVIKLLKDAEKKCRTELYKFGFLFKVSQDN